MRNERRNSILMSCHQELGSTSDRSCREKYFLQTITNIRWLIGTKHAPESKNTSQNLKHVPGSKTHPRIQNTFQNPKTLPWVQNTSQNPKTLPESQTPSIRESKNPSNNPKHVPKTKNTSKNPNTFPQHFWILGSVLDSGTCFWILGRVLDFGKCFVPMRHGTNTTQIKAVTRVTVLIVFRFSPQYDNSVAEF